MDLDGDPVVQQLSHALGLDATHCLMLNSSPERLLLPATDYQGRVKRAGASHSMHRAPSKGAAHYNAIAAGVVNISTGSGGAGGPVGSHVSDGPRVR